MTIYDALAAKLGRKPTDDELKADMKRILIAAYAIKPAPLTGRDTEKE